MSDFTRKYCSINRACKVLDYDPQGNFAEHDDE